MELNKENLRRFVMEGVGDVERIFKHDEDQTTTEVTVLLINWAINY